MSKLPTLIEAQLSKLLDDMSEVVGKEYRVTFIARNTERPNADIVLSDDIRSKPIQAALRQLHVEKVEQL